MECPCGVRGRVLRSSACVCTRGASVLCIYVEAQAARVLESVRLGVWVCMGHTRVRAGRLLDELVNVSTVWPDQRAGDLRAVNDRRDR